MKKLILDVKILVGLLRLSTTMLIKSNQVSGDKFEEPFRRLRKLYLERGLLAAGEYNEEDVLKNVQAIESLETMRRDLQRLYGIA